MPIQSLGTFQLRQRNTIISFQKLQPGLAVHQISAYLFARLQDGSLNQCDAEGSGECVSQLSFSESTTIEVSSLEHLSGDHQWGRHASSYYPEFETAGLIYSPSTLTLHSAFHLCSSTVSTCVESHSWRSSLSGVQPCTYKECLLISSPPLAASTRLRTSRNKCLEPIRSS